ncbi:Protein CBG08332 [Caenorhabditis briggsae]|uniref:Protein CBG08332 n=1 Tax=Caenorhabditis briggsae TaxID=6238 RepID=A8X6B7_CAEBR|nr:Protein CBG08332 [Caenorhabditis briggsae]CAP28178.1 Protein CBG08332 [Caenorhabditis briggsae]
MLPTRHSINPNHGSDANFIRNNTFGVEEPNTKTTIWYKWISNRIRQYMIPEIFYFISLVLILYRLQTLSNQNDRVLETINSMQSKFANMERKIESLVSQKPNQDISPFDNTEPLEQSIANVLKSMKTPEQDSIEKMEPIIPQSKQGTTKTAESTSEVSVSKEQYRFNATDYLKRASVDNDYSSSSNLNPIIGYDQTNLVLLDRPEPPADKAWCSNTQNPVLSINLAKYIKPISVSYQHSKWNGTIPNGAPRTYDVVTDKSCTLLYNNSCCSECPECCEECLISNYNGRTLGNIVGYTMFSVVIGMIAILVLLITDKNCTVLYKNNCFTECPECCQECSITDYNGTALGNIVGNTILGIIIGILSLMFLFLALAA